MFSVSPPPPNMGFSIADAHGHPDAVAAAGHGALTGMFGPPSSDPATVAVTTAASLIGMLTGTPFGTAVAAGIGASNAQTDVMSGLTGLTPGEISASMMADNMAAADAAANTGPGGADPESQEQAQRRRRRERRGSFRIGDLGDELSDIALPSYHEGGMVRGARKPGLDTAIMAEGGEFVVARRPAVKYAKLLEAINAGAAPKKVRSLLEAMTG